MSDGSEFGFPPFQDLSDQETPFYAALGRMTVEWSLLESNVRALLGDLCGGDDPKQFIALQVLTAELGSLGLVQALNTMAAEVLALDEATAIKHATTYFDRLRVYRNYYTHDLMEVIAFSDGTFGRTSAVEAKGKLVFRQEKIETDHLTFVARHAHILRYYVRSIMDYRYWLKSPERDQLLQPPQLPRTPPLPDAIQKPGIRLAWRPPFDPSTLQ